MRGVKTISAFCAENDTAKNIVNAIAILTLDFFGRVFTAMRHFCFAKSNTRTPSVCLRQPPPSMREAKGEAFSGFRCASSDALPLCASFPLPTGVVSGAVGFRRILSGVPLSCASYPLPVCGIPGEAHSALLPFARRPTVLRSVSAADGRRIGASGVRIYLTPRHFALRFRYRRVPYRVLSGFTAFYLASRFLALPIRCRYAEYRAKRFPASVVLRLTPCRFALRSRCRRALHWVLSAFAVLPPPLRRAAGGKVLKNARTFLCKGNKKRRNGRSLLSVA